MSKSTEKLVEMLVDRFTSLRPLLNEHLADNFNKLLPHVFFGDVARWIVSLATGKTAAAKLASRRELVQVLAFLETAYATGDEDQQELIAVSFLENLPSSEETGSEVRTMLGPSLAAQLRASG